MNQSPRFCTALALAVSLLALCLASAARAQEPAAKSSPAAIRQYRDAVAFQNRGVFDLAADEWEKFLKDYGQDPLAAKAQHYLGVCQLQLKRYDQAAASLEKVIAAYPKFELLESSYLNLGLAQYSQGTPDKPEPYDKAAATLSALVAKFPKSEKLPQALYFLGESLYARGKKQEAAKAYTHLVEQYPKDAQRPDALYALGVARQELGQHAEAGAAYDLFLKEFDKHALRAEVIMRRGETLLATGKPADAEKWFASAAAVKDFALADYATTRQAASLYEQKKYAEAAALYASVPAKFPKSQHRATATLAAGNCYFLAGNYAEAQKWLAAAVAAGGESAPEAAHWLSRALLKQSQPAEALKVVDKALLTARASRFAVDLAMDRADAIYEIPARRGEATALYAALADQHPDHALAGQALYMAGFSALNQGEHAKALELAERFLRSRGSDPLAVDVQYVAAEANLQLGRHADAESLYRKLLAGQPNHADAGQWQVRLGLSLHLQKKFADAVKQLQAAAPSLTKPDQAAEAWYLAGSAQIELQDNQAAAKSLAASLAAQPKWRQADETLLALAAAQRQLGQMPEALASVRKMLAQFPESRHLDRAHYRLGEYAYAGGDYKSSAAEYQLVAERWPASALVPHALYGLGWSQLNQKDYAASVATLTSLLEKHANHALAPRARYARAVGRQQLQQHEGAIEDAAAFLKTNPSGPERSDARYVQGLALAGLKRYDEAVDVFRTLLTDDARYAGADKVLYEWGWAVKSRGHEKDAAGIFARLAKEHADSPLAAEAFYHAGEARYQDKDYSQAAQAYFSAMSKAGKTDLGEKAAHKLAWANYQQGQFDKAQQAFAYQVATWPEGELAADGSFMECESLFKQNKHEPALAAYQNLLAKPPANKEFQALALLHAGQSAGQLKQWQESLKLLQRCTSELPDSSYAPEVLYEQGWAQQNLAKLDEAMKLYEQVAAASEREVGARARFMLGEVLFEKKQHKEAVRNYFKVAYAYGYPNAPEAIRKWQAAAAYEAGRCFEVLKDVKQAVKSYQEVVEKYPKSEHAPAAKARLEALGG